MTSVYDAELQSILEDFGNQLVNYEEAIEKIKDNFVTRLEPYIGDDYDHARKVLAL